MSGVAREASATRDPARSSAVQRDTARSSRVYELAAYPAFAAIKFEFTTRNGLESKTRGQKKEEKGKKGE